MKKLINLVLAASLCIMYSCGNKENKSMEADKSSSSTETNKAIYMKVMDAFQTGNIDSLANYVTENTVDHNQDPMIKSTGLQALKDAIAMVHTAYPDLKITMISMIGEWDMVVAHFNMKGTNTGAYGT